MTKKHFLFISCMNYSDWGGSEELWSQSAIRLKYLGHNVSASVGGLTFQHHKSQMMIESGIDVLKRGPVRYQRVKNLLYNEILRKSINFQKIAFEKWVIENSPDLIIINQPTNNEGIEWLGLLQKVSIPYVVISQSAADFQWPSNHQAQQLRKLFENSLCNYFVSHQNHQLTEYLVGDYIPNANVVFNPFKVNYQQDFQWDFMNTIPKIAVVARVEPHSKGHDLLLLALKNLGDSCPNFEISFFGGGENQDVISRMITRLDLPNVYMRGFVSDISKIWSEHEMLLLPSRSEGFPLALIEAALCGRPAIVTDVGGNTELVKDGATGYLIESREVHSVASGLVRALKEREKWKMMGQNMMNKARSLIPKDPISDFSDKLENLAQNL